MSSTPPLPLRLVSKEAIGQIITTTPLGKARPVTTPLGTERAGATPLGTARAGGVRVATPRRHDSKSPCHSPRFFESSEDASFHTLICRALRAHEDLLAKKSHLEAESQQLKMDLARIKQEIYLTHRPDANPVSLFPLFSTMSDKAHDKNEIVDEQSFGNGTQAQFEDELVPESPLPKTLVERRDSNNGSDTSDDAMRERARKMHEVRLMFNRMDREGHGEIHCLVIEEILRKDRMNHKRSSTKYIAKMNEEDVSCLQVIKAVSCFLGHAQTAMTFPTFVEIMTKEDLDEVFQPEICEKILLIRSVLTRAEMTKVVARYTHMATADLAEAEIQDTHVTRIPPFLELLSGSAIILNAVLLGVSADVHTDSKAWEVIEYCFTFFFSTELVVKAKILGWMRFLCGSDAAWNFLDGIIVLLAVIDAALSIVVSADESNMKLFTMMRLARIARITRLVRLLRLKVFKELLLMVRGTIAGMRTIFWAIVLLSLFVFVLGLLVRQTMGRWCDPELRENNERSTVCVEPHLQDHSRELFSTVPRACLTIFRCFTDDCNAPDGTPLILHLYNDNDYGPLYVFFYVLIFLFVTFGLFNLIMAIFVENTMESAKQDERKRKRLARVRAVRLAHQLQKLVLKCAKATNKTILPWESENSDRLGLAQWFYNVVESWTGNGQARDYEELELSPVGLEVEISRDTFSKVVADPKVEKLLDELEVAVSDPMDLFDTLDADGSGHLDVYELIKGLLKLRGAAEKSDVVACLLAVRSIQKNMDTFKAQVLESQGDMFAEQEKVVSHVKLLDNCMQEVLPGYRQHMKVLTQQSQLPRARTTK